MQKRDRCTHGGRNFAGELHRSLDEFLSACANEKTFQSFRFTDCHQHWRLNRFNHFVCSFRAPVLPGCSSPAGANDNQIVAGV